MVEIGIVESTQDRLRAFVEPLALLLELTQNLEARLDAGGVFSCGVEDGLGILALVLGGLVVRHGAGGFGLGMFQRQMGRVGAALEILEVRGNLSSGTGGGFDLILQKVESRFSRFTASGGGGNFAAKRVETRLGIGKFGTLRGEFALGGDAFLPDLVKSCGMLVERRLVGAEALDHLLEQRVGLLDLLLLGADFFLGLENIQTVPLDQRRRLGGALMVGRNPILGRENPVAERLHAVADRAGLGFDFLEALAEGIEFDLLLRDLDLMNLAGLFALVELGAERFEFRRKRTVVFMRKVGIENPEVVED